MKWLSVIGARPHFMKLAPLVYQLKNYPAIDHVIVHSGQHYDDELSANFLKEFELPKPNYNLNIGSGTANFQIGSFLLNIDEILDCEKPDLVIVYGDTNTTAAGAVAAASRNIPVAHIEAGLREWNKAIPEEINKLITDSVTDYYFCPTKQAVNNLDHQGITKNVYLTGDITLDLLANYSEYEDERSIKHRYGIEGNIHLFTSHRVNNTENAANLKEIANFLNHTDYEFIWPMHPRMKSALLKHGWIITNPKVKLTTPIAYWETQSIIRASRMVVTDSGGIIKEAYFHKVPAIIIDQQTEWTEAVEEGWHRISGPSSQKIEDFLNEVPSPQVHSQAFGNGDAAKQIVNILRSE